ncbi:DUF2513 domain-containing protein [Clostridium sp. YIM B02569]|uniref:DUF2513 domain-containing protein n=1 Tax=Clostridium sp. YIM B02569 TaxID=2911967 RepID=UPI001EEF41D1|nr:DUF2513 domain-containing protein [Clostridium sp. YIM B02569]
MNLNNDCIKDILLTIEENTSSTEYMLYEPDKNKYERLKPYSSDEVIYNAKYCDSLELFERFTLYVMNTGFSILGLSSKGHSYLEDIRN